MSLINRKIAIRVGFAALLIQATPVKAEAVPASSQTKPPAMTLDLPTKLLGSDCRKSEVSADDAKIVICISPNFMTGGIVGVTVSATPSATYEQLVDQMRESFHESGPLKIVSEERFAPASAPDAIGLRAEYRTGAGRKYVWSVFRDGAFTRVLVTVLGRPERSAIEPEIIEKVFGADRYPPRAEAAAAPQEAVNP